jgi:hypothetical protein
VFGFFQFLLDLTRLFMSSVVTWMVDCDGLEEGNDVWTLVECGFEGVEALVLRKITSAG